jgi:hypothetical protein
MVMDLINLHETTRRAYTLIEGWDSLIWTERYNDLGEFQLKSPNVADIMTLMPLGSYCAIKQSEQPMVVENHLIEIDDDGKQILTVSGRAMECLLEDRTNLNSISAIGTSTGVTPVDAPNILVILVSTLGIHVNDPSFMYPVEDDRISEITVQQEFFNATFPNYTLADDVGELYASINRMLKQTNYGLRGIRPKNAESGFLISLYNGNDLSESVIFRTALGHIKVKSYLFSIKGYKNVAYIRTIHGANQYTTPGLFPTPTGIERRDLYVDGSDIDVAAGAPLNSMMKQRAQSELLKNNKTSSFDFEILPSNPYVFGTDYYLGDLVVAQADYGLSQFMRVSEFIRTEDEQGYREFPTLIEDVPADYI